MEKHPIQQGEPDQEHEPPQQRDQDIASQEGDQPMDVEPPPVNYGRGHRAYQPIQRYKDFTATSTVPFNIPSTLLEDSTDSIDPTRAQEKEISPCEVLRRMILDYCSWRTTPANQFGLYKKFWTLESRPHDPDSYVTSEDLQEGNEEGDGDSDESKGPSTGNPLFPFPNWSSFLLGEWYWDDSQERGQESFRRLVEILTSNDFSTQEIRAANWDRINRSLAASEFEESMQGFEWTDDGTSWLTTTVELEVPFNRTFCQPGVHQYEVHNFRYRPIVPVIQERLRDAT